MTDKKRPLRYNFLLEQTSIVSPSDIKIIEEGKTESGQSRVAFQARLQEQGVRNTNRRIYDQTVCESIVGQLGPKAKARNMLMEVDHPMFFSGANDPTTMKRRATIIEIKNCGAVCRKIGIHNGQILGEIETLSGFNLSPN